MPRRFSRVAATVTLATVVVMAGARGAFLHTGLGNGLEWLLGLLAGIAVVAVAWALTAAAGHLLGRLPRTLVTAFIAALLALAFLDTNSMAEIARALADPGEWELPLSPPTGLDVASLFVVALAAGLVAGVAALGRERASGHPLITGLTGLALVAALAVAVSLALGGGDPYGDGFAAIGGPAPAAPVPADPAAPGGHVVERLSYGSGGNPRRPEFGADRDLESRSVDASRVLPEWKGIRRRMRERYWGFTIEEAPLNGLVWAPRGGGPFPLVLVVHGNHAMEDYSDPGYAYLGELLASRGFITVSVDENYLNGTWSGDFRGKEMAARAFLLLEHLKLWRDWNDTPGHRFGGRVDMARIALIGHSRGGEAVSIAAAFNRLPHFPDDATVAFDYDFDIRSLVAIAQVDQRYHRRVELEDVNFLTLHGSWDSDEPAYHGLRQFNRIGFSGDGWFFKAGLYIHGANHGQFNTAWGRRDYGPPASWLLNVAPIIPAADQRLAAKVYVAAFLETTLKGDLRYLPLFTNPAFGADWLPDHPYVPQFRDSTFRPLATFEEDLDVETGTGAGVTLAAQGVSLWREEELRHRDERRQGSSAVVLGWREGDDPVYSIDVPEGFWSDAGPGAEVLTLAISSSTEEVPADGEDVGEATASDDSKERPQAPQLRIEAVLADGRKAFVQAADFAALAPPLRVQFLKHADANEARYKAAWEPVLQVLDVPLAALAARGDSIRRIRLHFARPAGVVLIDDIGVRAASIPRCCDPRYSGKLQGRSEER